MNTFDYVMLCYIRRRQFIFRKTKYCACYFKEVQSDLNDEGYYRGTWLRFSLGLILIWKIIIETLENPLGDGNSFSLPHLSLSFSLSLGMHSLRPFVSRWEENSSPWPQSILWWRKCFNLSPGGGGPIQNTWSYYWCFFRLGTDCCQSCNLLISMSGFTFISICVCSSIKGSRFQVLPSLWAGGRSGMLTSFPNSSWLMVWTTYEQFHTDSFSLVS